MRITDEKLHGRVVITADGRAIGEVTRLFFEGGVFAIDAIEIKLRKDAADALGLEHKGFRHPTIEIPVRLVQSVGDALILSAVLADLRELPMTDTQPERSPELDRDRVEAHR